VEVSLSLWNSPPFTINIKIRVINPFIIEYMNSWVATLLIETTRGEVLMCNFLGALEMT
jgi:hypothetical protein